MRGSFLYGCRKTIEDFRLSNNKKAAAKKPLPNH